MQTAKNGTSRGRSLIAIGIAALMLISQRAAAEQQGNLHSQAAPMVKRALAFLEHTQQPDGGWIAFDKSDPAITALVVKCFIQSPEYGPDHPIVRRALEFMLKFAKPDGGIYVEDRGIRNYQTSVCLMALAATDDKRYEKQIQGAQQFLVDLQWDEGEGHEPGSVWYGGAGYGRHKRPDLSNTQMMLEALHQSGLPPTHPVYKKAMVFIRRSQMLSPYNDQPFAAGSSDGGFVYTPANGGESKAGEEETEAGSRLRTYGSMTYAGFKSMLYAQVARDDPRVRAAYAWIRRHYTLQANPNMPGAQSKEGLFYYYHVFAKALSAWGDPVLVDAAGRRHDWRAELLEALEHWHREDGSFVNEADRWMESNPYLVTAYSVLSIQEALTDR